MGTTKSYKIYIPAVRVEPSVSILTEQELKMSGREIIRSRLVDQVIETIDQLNASGITITDTDTGDKKEIEIYISVSSDAIGDSISIPLSYMLLETKKEN